MGVLLLLSRFGAPILLPGSHLGSAVPVRAAVRRRARAETSPGTLSREGASEVSRTRPDETGGHTAPVGVRVPATEKPLGVTFGGFESETAPHSAALGRPKLLRESAGFGRRDSDWTGVRGRRSLSITLAVLAMLSLGACAADEIGVRATLQDYGLHGVGVTLAPSFGRPCRFGEPFAAKFTAHDDRGANVSGWLCSADEWASDARIILDRGGV